MNNDSSTEMYALWEQYNRVRVAGAKKQANQILDTFLKCFKDQTPEVKATFVEKVCSKLLDPITDDTTYNGHYLCTNGVQVSDLPIRIQFPLFRDAILPELIRRFNIHDARAIRWIGQLEQFFYANQELWQDTCAELDLPFPVGSMFFFKRSFAIKPEQTTLRMIIKTYAMNLSYDCHHMPDGILCEPEQMNQTIADARNYWNQLEASPIKDEWNECLGVYERIAASWDDYCTHRFLYDNFEHYLAKNKIEWVGRQY